MMGIFIYKTSIFHSQNISLNFSENTYKTEPEVMADKSNTDNTFYDVQINSKAYTLIFDTFLETSRF